MDPNFDSTIFSNTDASSSSSSIDPLMFSNISLQSLLTYTPNNSLFHSSLTDLPSLPESTIIDNNNKKQHFLIPKSEHPNLFFPVDDFFSQLQQPFNFIPQPTTFHRLPQLHSPEPEPEPSFKRLRHTPPPPPPARGKAPSMIPQSNLARQRRQKLSEKTRCLQKLMPWDKKMDQATLLEEAYKYVKFLQAQFCVLQSMPSNSFPLVNVNNGNNNNNNNGSVLYGELERLNRNQVLEVLVNSPVAQTKLYSQGLCVFSMEQLFLLRKLSEKRQQQQQMSDQASSKTFFN